MIHPCRYTDRSWRIFVNRDYTSSDLRLSSLRVGRLYPVLLDKHGNIIDGEHRLAIDATWPRMTVESIETEEELLTARLISNVCRRKVTRSEKAEIINRLAELWLREGGDPRETVSSLSKRTGMSYRWVMQYLSDKYKQRPGLGGPSDSWKLDKSLENIYKSKVARCATIEYGKLLSSPRHNVVHVKNYANTDFVNLLVDRRFYENFTKACECLGFPPERIINNSLVAILNEIEKVSAPNPDSRTEDAVT